MGVDSKVNRIPAIIVTRASAVDLPSFNFLPAWRISVSVIGSSKMGTRLLVVTAKSVSSRMIDLEKNFTILELTTVKPL